MKGNNMLPFIAGAVIGVAGILAFNNKKKTEKGLSKGAVKLKKWAEQTSEKTKVAVSELKKSVEEKMDCLQSKKTNEEKKEIL
jgi:hypothetical protein